MQNNWYEVFYWIREKGDQLRVGANDIAAINEECARDVMEIRLDDQDCFGILYIDEVWSADEA